MGAGWGQGVQGGAAGGGSRGSWASHLTPHASITTPVNPRTTVPPLYLLPLQADRRALNITLNSIGTELTRDDRRKLYADFGQLYPHGQAELAVAEDFDAIRSAMEKCPPYQAIFSRVRVV